MTTIQAAPAGAGLLTIAEFGRRYQLSRTSIYAHLRHGGLRACKLGRHTRIREEDAEAWAARLPDYAPQRAA